jgi:hypothetical protein
MACSATSAWTMTTNDRSPLVSAPAPLLNCGLSVIVLVYGWSNSGGIRDGTSGRGKPGQHSTTNPYDAVASRRAPGNRYRYVGTPSGILARRPDRRSRR